MDKKILNYEDAQKRFRNHFDEFKKQFSDVSFEPFAVDEKENLYIDVLKISEGKDRTLIFTIGEHGVEGIFGSFIMEVFINEILPSINLKDTTVILVHPINPFGMKNIVTNSIHFVRTYAHFFTILTECFFTV
jgi:hypothetical protein